MVAPSGEGAIRCMRQALSTVKGDIDYINTHGTSTPVGDSKEIGAIREVFGDKIPHIQSTKSLTGHSLGAAGVQESIYGLLMMQERFIGESAHISELDPEFAGCSDRSQPHRQRQDRHHPFQFLRLRRHQRHARLPAS